jgi:hypothetical protein
MNPVMNVLAGAASLPFLLFCMRGDSAPQASRQSDVVYGHKLGVGLTMEVFTPVMPNGIGVLWVVSSSGKSSRELTLQDSFERRISPLLDRGYVVFAVIHGSAPVFNVQDFVSDVRRAVRFVRERSARFGVDGRRLGLAGSSSGGLLALMVAMEGEDGNPGVRGCGGTRISPSTGGRLLLSADRPHQLRQRLREHRRSHAEERRPR